RLATGAYILNSGLSKRDADEKEGAALHANAARAFPFLEGVDPVTFARLMSTGEILLGSALLLPLVPSALAGLGLTAFGAGLVNIYVRTPWLHEPGSVRPNHDGQGLAKDV